jgi:internalin A
MSSNPEGWAIALQRIADEAEARTGALDLGGLELTELPQELFALTSLRELNIGSPSHEELLARDVVPGPIPGNRLKSGLERLTALTQLRTLSVSGTAIVDLSWAKQLTGLESLDCSVTRVSDLAPLRGLAGLQSLDCHLRPLMISRR